MLKNFLIKRRQLIRKAGVKTSVANYPVFTYENGKVIDPSQFRKFLKNLLSEVGIDHTDYNTHSLRIGGATLLARNGVSNGYIKALGRWRSNIFEQYIRPTEIDMAKLSQAFFLPVKFPGLIFNFNN